MPKIIVLTIIVQWAKMVIFMLCMRKYLANSRQYRHGYS